MKKILLLMFIAFISICSSYSQGNGRVVKVIYDGCGYTSGVSTYNDGRKVFSLMFSETIYLDGFNVISGTAQEVYDMIKFFSKFVEEHEDTDGYTEDINGYNLMIVKSGKGAVGITAIKFLVVSFGGKNRRCDISCIKKGKRAFEKYCKKNKIQLE